MAKRYSIDELSLDQLDWLLGHRLLKHGLVLDAGVLFELTPAGQRKRSHWRPSRCVAQAVELVVEHRIAMRPAIDGRDWKASWEPISQQDLAWDWRFDASASTYEEAAMRCLCKMLFGQTTTLPPAIARLSGHTRRQRAKNPIEKNLVSTFG